MTPAATDWRVRVRMYCQGLGDCFLLTFRDRGVLLGHVLIDCGVLNPSYSKLRDAVADIATETNGKIDVVVVTHEHWDHVSGFSQARDLFDKLAISDVWVAWTENPNDQEGAALHKRYDKLKNALDLVVSTPGHPSAAEIQALMGFSGWDSARFAFSNSTREAMDYVLARMRNSDKKGKFCTPGQSLSPLGPTTRFHILGPPRGKLLKKKDPVEGSSETYELALASASLGDLNQSMTLDYPFEAIYKLSATTIPSFSNLQSILNLYAAPSDQWRRIDSDWLNGSAELALQMDSYTNNTSLALAIELDNREVLLFPGDAQVGNWQSWHEISWENPEVNTNQLLAHATLYKAGHHASHNGTLREGGLELMNSLRDVLIPTDEAFALTRNPVGSWQMPAKALYSALDEKSNHHVYRSDQPLLDGVPGKIPLFMDAYV
jgi:hypothetical protein